MKHALPDIARTAARIRAILEETVQRFPRKDRYCVGSDLRNRAREVVRLALGAWNEPQRRLIRVRELSTAIDALKLDMQLAKDVNAFRSNAQFEMISRQIIDLGRQCGGWLKELLNKGQNGQTRKDAAQRASTLSGRYASDQGANP